MKFAEMADLFHLWSVYHGNRARYHYFQCLQLVLRHQVKALVELWKLPPEFEVRPLSSARRISVNFS